MIGGKSSEDLAKKIAKKVKAKFIKTDLRVFPDGESKITLRSKNKGRTIVVVQSTYPPVDTNLIQAMSLVYKARELSSNVIAVIPYLGYARQDREFLPGEIITMKVIAKLFQSLGTKKIIFVDIHSTIGLKTFKIKAQNISAIPELVKYFKKLHLKNPLIVSPDVGGEKRAKEFAKLFKTDYTALKKKRDRKSGKVKIMNSSMKSIAKRDLILVDDMISTGGSIIKASEFLKKQKCNKIFVACTHALLINDAEKKIKKAGVTKIVSTNTIPRKTSEVDVSNIIAQAIL